MACGLLPKAANAKSCWGTTPRTATPRGEARDMESTVVAPNVMSSHPSPIGGTLGLLPCRGTRPACVQLTHPTAHDSRRGIRRWRDCAEARQGDQHGEGRCD